MKKVTVPSHLAPLLEQMSRDMAVPVEGLVNQAVFNWARLHGYAEPSVTVSGGVVAPSTHADASVPDLKIAKTDPEPRPKPSNSPEPVTARVGITPEPPPDARPTQASGLDWQVTSGGGSFGAADMADMTSPSIKRMREIVLFIDGREATINADRYVIGRDPACNLTVEAPRISRMHAVIHTTPDVVELEDLNSSNGTWMNDERVTKIELQNGDEFFLGDVPVRIEFR